MHYLSLGHPKRKIDDDQYGVESDDDEQHSPPQQAIADDIPDPTPAAAPEPIINVDTRVRNCRLRNSRHVRVQTHWFPEGPIIANDARDANRAYKQYRERRILEQDAPDAAIFRPFLNTPEYVQRTGLGLCDVLGEGEVNDVNLSDGE